MYNNKRINFNLNIKEIYIYIYIILIVPPEVSLINLHQSQSLGKETILQCDVSASPFGVNIWRFGDREFDQPSGPNYRTDMYKDNHLK